MEIEKKLKEIEIVFVGEHGWEKMRDLSVLKMSECRTEEEFTFFLKAMLGSCFMSVDAINEARKEIGVSPLSKKEENAIRKLEKKK